jgi:ribulose-bisphosphate carboxylase large chain
VLTPSSNQDSCVKEMNSSKRIAVDESLDSVFATYLIRSEVAPREAAESVAREQSSLGARAIPEMGDRFYARVRDVRKRDGLTVAQIEYPKELCGTTITQLLNVISGEIHHIRKIDRIKLTHIALPPYYHVKREDGIFLVKQKLGDLRLPYVCAAIKPPAGIPLSESAYCAREAYLGGIPIVKDDELLSFHTIEDLCVHVEEMSRTKREAEDACGEKRVYICNLIGTPFITPIHLERLLKLGCDGVLLSPYLQGFGYCSHLIETIPEILYFAHNSLMSIFSGTMDYGISLPILFGLATMAGFDFHVLPSPYGTFIASEEEIRSVFEIADSNAVTRDCMVGLAGRMNPSDIELIATKMRSTSFALVVGSWLFGDKHKIRERASILRLAAEDLRSVANLPASSNRPLTDET